MRPHANWVKIKLTVYSTIIPWLLSTIIVQTDMIHLKNSIYRHKKLTKDYIKGGTIHIKNKSVR